ncbi:TPA: EpsG family protein [Vibrio parahaemolyticus]
MLFWLVLILFTTFIPILRRENYLLVISWVILTLFSALRYHVGPDFIQYEYIYSTLTSGGTTAKEVGYYFIVMFSDFIGGNAQTVFIIFSIIISTFFYLFISRSSNFFEENSRYEYKYLMLLFFIAFYYFQSMNQIRQFAAIAVSLFALLCFVNKKILLSVILIFFASSFHVSALLLLGLLPFMTIKMSHKALIILLVSIAFIEPINLIKSIYINLKLPYYGYLAYVEFANETSMVGRLSTYISSIVIVTMLSFLNIPNKRMETVFKNAIVLYITFRLMALDFEQINRIANYFKPFVFVMFSILVLELFNKYIYKRMALSAFFFMLLTFSSAIYIYRSSSDISYSHYTLNYCILSDSVCPIVISENLWK